MFWHPETSKKGKSLYSSNPELLARFVKDSALNKREMLPGLYVTRYFCSELTCTHTHGKKSRPPDLDHVDVTARQETLTACQGQPVLVQLPLVPSYALTVHKTQVRPPPIQSKPAQTSPAKPHPSQSIPIQAMPILPTPRHCPSSTWSAVV